MFVPFSSHNHTVYTPKQISTKDVLPISLTFEFICFISAEDVASATTNYAPYHKNYLKRFMPEEQ
ncbi:hypothetical protein A0J61_08220 [Choanephora cucurbitarum]|uniref:Uncharacterized protein n=1 Tax=Choanephora cucurbitarum TaxID=101091 RepID=A0A1C7N3Y5_9FUNG|nr:hypothetical protein A0J61_08220 [Choanephora cucurbitarum]